MHDDVAPASGPSFSDLDLLTDALGDLLLEDDMDDEDLRAAANTLLPTLYDALREAGYGAPALRERT